MLDTLWKWVLGDLTPSARIWTALAPVVLVTAYFLVGLLLFSVRCLVKGMPRDSETLTRGANSLVGFFWRHYFFWVIRPLWSLLVRSKLPASAITMLAVFLAIAAGVAVAAGRFAMGGWLFLAGGILDVMDGRIARTTKTASPRGAALDSVLDRYADNAILVGLAWYYRNTWVLLPILMAFVGTGLVPYVRAKGESLGIPIKGGLMQRLERVLFLGVGTAFAPILEAALFPHDEHPMHWLAVGGILVVSLLSNTTALQRLRELLDKLSPARPHPRAVHARIVTLSLVSSVLATGMDFGVVLGLVEAAGFDPALATLLGCAVGGVVNYGFNRLVTFRSSSSLAPQAARYALVSATSAALNAGGVALLGLLPAVPYVLSWWLVRGVIFFGWNLPLQRDYVFSEQDDADARAPLAA